jgi:hypothetical protein
VKVAPAPASAAREELSDLARRIHDATKVPLYAPATYAELFKFLTEEVAANGYHFQQTAENVANRLTEAGRNVTKRQIGFVVKGLALKGHSFTAEDKPEALAAGFREQVLYLAGNADLKLSERDKELVAAWIVGAPGDHLDIEIPTGDALVRKGETAEVSQFPGKRAKALAPPATGVSAGAAPGGAIAGAASAGAAPAAAGPEAAPPSAAPAATGDVEDSILAAIAEAVDVLVDKPAAPVPAPAPAAASVRPPLRPAASPKAPTPPPPAEDDIGNEIQKILANYTQSRQESGGRR